MFSDTDANEILAKHAAATTNKTSNVSKILEDSRNSVSNSIKIAPIIEGVPYFHKEMVLDVFGPAPPTEEQVRSQKFVEHIRPIEVYEKAAGFSEDIACLRALQDAMSGLYFVPGKDD